MKKFNPNSALHWLERVEARLGPWMPVTRIVPYEHQLLIAAIEDDLVLESDYLLGLFKAVHEAANFVGFPAFLRTDLSSAKHGGPDSYLIKSLDDVCHVVMNTASDNEMKFWLDPRGGPSAFLVRRFLKLKHEFTAFDGLPIAKEWRFFATGRAVICAHPYWPEEAFDGLESPLKPSQQDWKTLLKETQRKPVESAWDALMDMATAAASAATLPECPAWSVDFASDRQGKWWLIDMAVMEESWHWPSCEYATQPSLPMKG